MSTLKEAGHLQPLLVANAVHVEGRKGDFPQGLGQDSKAGDSFVLVSCLATHGNHLGLGTKPGIWSRGETSSCRENVKVPQPILPPCFPFLGSSRLPLCWGFFLGLTSCGFCRDGTGTSTCPYPSLRLFGETTADHSIHGHVWVSAALLLCTRSPHLLLWFENGGTVCLGQAVNRLPER